MHVGPACLLVAVDLADSFGFLKPSGVCRSVAGRIACFCAIMLILVVIV